jgi:hypothetical protein
VNMIRERIGWLWTRKRIRQLSEVQQALLGVVREEWLRVGLALRTDWKAVRRIVPAVYLAVGLAPPKSIIALDSPNAGLLAAARTSATLGCRSDDVLHQITKRARRRIRHEVRAEIRDQVRTCVREEAEGQIRRPLRDQIESQLRNQLPYLSAHFGDVQFGLQEAPRLAFYDFFLRIGVEGVSSIAPLIELARAGAGWWWAFRKVAIVTSAPSALERDVENRLHSTDGPALAYPDGWAIWAIHGVVVPKRVVTDSRSLGIEEIAHEPDLAVRRLMLERFGYERFVRQAGLKPVQADHFGRLYRLDPGQLGNPYRPATEPIALVEVVNATPEPDRTRRRYFLCVPPTVRSAHEAVAWTFGMSTSEYRPVVES